MWSHVNKLKLSPHLKDRQMKRKNSKYYKGLELLIDANTMKEFNIFPEAFVFLLLNPSII